VPPRQYTCARKTSHRPSTVFCMSLRCSKRGRVAYFPRYSHVLLVEHESISYVRSFARPKQRKIFTRRTTLIHGKFRLPPRVDIDCGMRRHYSHHTCVGGKQYKLPSQPKRENRNENHAKVWPHPGIKEPTGAPENYTSPPCGRNSHCVALPSLRLLKSAARK
jgi:hypothetical protein